MLFSAFISRIMLQRKFNIKLNLDTQNRYFTSIGAFTFLEVDNQSVQVSSSQYNIIMNNVDDLLLFVRGIR